jgi:Hemerythrin HHE cation binding domain
LGAEPARAPEDTMGQSIIDLLRRDHTHMEQLIERYGTQGPGERRDTFRELVDLVVPHAFAEEAVLFPTARRVAPAQAEAITSHIETEHQGVNDVLKRMERRAPGDPAFERDALQLFALLRAGARDEEDQLMPVLAERMDATRLEQVGSAWALAKKAAPNRVHPRLPRRPPLNVLASLPLFFVDRLRGVFARLRHAPQ